jgi:hypothetical protein
MKKIIYNPNNYKKDYIESTEEYYKSENQVKYLKNFINDNNDIVDISLNMMIKREISKKMSSYKSQDKKNNKYDNEKHISYEELVKKLESSNLKCYYCNSNLFLLYKKRGEPLQWSLERFDNNIGHYNSNTCISCLKCNLQRRTDNYEYFKYSKNMTIIKS